MACALTLAACGGGGGGSSTTPSVVSNGGGSGTGTGTQSTATAPVSVAVSLQQYAPVVTSSTARKAQFISPATAQISLKLISVNGQTQTGTAQTYNVGPNVTNCASVSGLVTCNLDSALPIGTDVIEASTIDAGGTTLGKSQIQATIVQNATNRIPLAVGGNIAKIQMYLSTHSFVTGTQGTANVLVVPFDSSGAAIVNPGNYSPAIAITATNPAGHFSFITNGTTGGLTTTINSPNDQVVLKYDGAGNSGTINMTANAGTGITDSSSASYSTNIPAFAAAPSGTQLVTAFTSYIFTAAGQTGGIVASGGVPPYSLTSSDPNVVMMTGGTSPNFTISSVGYGTTGSASIILHDSATPSATTTIPVTFIAPPISLNFTTCGSTCTTSVATWVIPLGGPLAALASTTVAATGGTGTYSYIFVSSGTQTSAYDTMVQNGNQFSFTPTGFGNDALFITSGNQSAYYGINASANAFGQAIPAAIGFLVEGTGKAYTATLPSFVSFVSQISGSPIGGFNYSSTGPTLTATPTAAGSGKLSFSNGLSSTQVPYTTFGVTFSTYAGLGYTQSTETFNAPHADEALIGIGVSDTATVTGMAGVLQATSSNTAVVTVSVASSVVTVTSVGPGFASITLKDAGTLGTGATVTYPVSVTSTTIPIASHARLP